ncbi:hypothetical protein LSH36_93g01035 [Paralvinella palmiformis]|uniref:Anoctamin n=1 Tax=Paralvinella palmiformis TaxID=53620 RepID=A0AAD9NAA0_9ANNE|nr:hypothetical protein LSH36_93g01035 [Paralvinella palmiformis]
MDAYGKNWETTFLWSSKTGVLLRELVVDFNDDIHNGGSEETAALDFADNAAADNVVALDVDGAAIDEDKVKEQRESMYFDYSGERLRIDYVLVYKNNDKKPEFDETRMLFEQNLRDYGLTVYHSPDRDITDETLEYVLLHAPWDILITGAELMAMPKRLKMPMSLEKKLEKANKCEACSCDNACRTSQQYIPDEGDYFTAPFHRKRMELFEILDEETFFTNAERSLIVKEILDRTKFTPEDSSIARFGIRRLLQDSLYSSAYPLHEGPFKPSGPICEATFDGPDKDRALLYETWARIARFGCKQPLDLIRKYFGEKIGLYFAWLGFYTAMLIPATIFGLAAFIYGLVTMNSDKISDDICHQLKDVVMCPQCNVRCEYWKLKESCIYSKITYVFDNYATVVFAFMMTIWAILFLEFWKRKQSELQYEWDVKSFEAQERMRPEFEFKVKKRKENPVTREKEPYLSALSKLCRGFTSLSIAAFFVLLVFGTILGVVIYRMIIVTLLYGVGIDFISTWAKIITSLTASVINLIIILILGLVYRKVAYYLTEVEMHRTETDFEDAYSFKMFLFQFANNFGSTFYIAFFKGKFQTEPGSTKYYLFGKYQPDSCDPSGCMVDLLIQLFIVMVGKQFLNQFKEIIIPKLRVCLRQRQAKKEEKQGAIYRRWMQDRDMQEGDRLMLFEEYIEMVIQYGFVVIFIAAFPLAPLFALLNNIVEIRLDAYKLITQYKRPTAMKAQDIGVWYNILQTITYIAVISNAVIIAWTSDFVPRVVYLFGYSDNQTLTGFINNSLSLFNTANYSDDTRPMDPGDGFTNIGTCRYKAYRLPPDSPRAYGYTEQFWKVLVARLAFILVFEHTCFIVMYMFGYVIPDKPAKVRRLETYEKALNRHLTFEATLEERRKSRRITQQFGY